MTKIIIKRRIALELEYEYYELTAEYDSSEDQGDDIITAFERQVAFIRTVTQTLEPAPAEISPEKSDPNTRIKDLREGDKKVDVVVRLVSSEAPKSFDKPDGTKGTFCKAKISDETGEMALTVWDDHIKTLQDIGDGAWLTIQGAYVKEYREKLELNVGKWARMDVAYYEHSEEE